MHNPNLSHLSDFNSFLVLIPMYFVYNRMLRNKLGFKLVGEILGWTPSRTKRISMKVTEIRYTAIRVGLKVTSFPNYQSVEYIKK